jgi:hypothetical protein
VPFDQTLPPLLRVVVALRPLEISTLLGKHVKWLRNGESEMSIHNEEKEKEQEKDEKVDKMPGEIRVITGGGGRRRRSRLGRPLTSARAAWSYALLARVDKPLSRKDASNMRSLGRYLSKMRAKQMTDSSDPRLARINVILTLIEVGFGQGRTAVV